MKILALTLATLVLLPVLAVVYFVYADGADIAELSNIAGTLPPLQEKQTAYLRIIQALQSGQLSSKSSPLTLPPSYKGVTLGNKVLHERKKDGRLWVLFPTWYGRGGDLQGYLYSSGPFRTQDFDTPGRMSQSIYACGVDNLQAERIDDHWYGVIRRMD